MMPMRSRWTHAIPAAIVLLAVVAVTAPLAASAQSEGTDIVFDALDEPRWITTTTTESGNTYALVASYLDNAVQIIDVTDPTAPMHVASIRDGEDGFEGLGGGAVVVVTTISDNTYALVAGYTDNAVQIIDVTDPAAPAPVSSFADGEGGFEGLEGPYDIEILTVSGATYAFVVGWLEDAIQVVDISDPASPVPVVVLRDGEGGFEGLAGSSSIALVSAQDNTYALVAGYTDNAIQIIDVTDPTDISPTGVISDGFDLSYPTHIDTATISGGTYALVASYGGSYVQIIDVTDIHSPSQTAFAKDGEDGFDGLFIVSRIEIVTTPDSTYMLASGFGEDAIQIIDVTDPTAISPAGVLVDGEGGFEGLGGVSSMVTVTASDRTYVLVTGISDDAIQVMDMTDPTAPIPVTAVYDAQDPSEDADTPSSQVDILRILDRFEIGDMEVRAISAVTDAVIAYAADGEGAFGALGADVMHAPDVFVMSADADAVIAHNVDPNMEGAVEETLSRADRPLDAILNDISVNGGTWVNHMFPHPDTGIIKEKRSWLYEYDGYIFGAGYYLRDSEIQSLVEWTVDEYMSTGEVAFDGIAYADGPVMFIHVDDAPDMFLHTTAKPYEQIIGELEVYGHTWTSHITQNPDAHTQMTARMWLELHDEHIFGAGYYLPDSRIQSLVEGAHLLYRSNGVDAFGMITPEESAHTDALYPFVLEFETSEAVAHGAYPHLLGAVPTYSLHNADRPWPQIQEELLANGDAWASYVFKNPDTQTDQLKRTYLQLHDGYVFASGYYLPDARVQTMVDLAVSNYRAGEDTFEGINSGAGPDMDDSYFTSVITMTGTSWAKDTPFDHVSDLAGLMVGADRSVAGLSNALARDGSAWFERVTINLATDTEQTKRIWLYLYDGFLFLSGYHIPDSEVQSAVDHAVFLYRNEGTGAFDMITQGVLTDPAEPHSFVLEFETSNILAHGEGSHLVGEMPELLVNGEKSWSQIQEELVASGGTWTSYASSAADTELQMRAWLYMHDGYVFVSGYHLRDALVQSITHNTIQQYMLDSDGAFAAINAISEEASMDTYPFVIDASTYEIVAHGADPSRNGDVAVAITQADRPAEEILADLEKGRGTWSHYTFVNPLTGEEESKRSWLSLHNGYIFGSGYYDGTS